MSIGWQFLYEGMWKYQSRYTDKPWTAAGYLKNAQGPFRDYYRSLVHDPDDLEKLDYEKVTTMWDDWHERFLAQHPELSDRDKRQLNEFLNGPESKKWVRAMETSKRKLPEGVDIAAIIDVSKLTNSSGKRDLNFVTIDLDRKRLETNRRLIPREIAKLKSIAVPIKHEAPEGQEPPALTDEERQHNAVVKIYHDTVKELGIVCSRLSLKEKLEVSLLWDKDRAGATITEEDHKKLYPEVAGTLDEHRQGEIDLYRNSLERYDANLKNIDEGGGANFQRDHLGKQWAEIQQKRAELVGPVNGWTEELIRYSDSLLSAEQLARGGVPMQVTKTDTTNQRTIWALLILGALMFLGLFSRLSALGSAGLLLLFYFAMPPFPGLPAAPGPEHSLIVNKNLIEVLACLVLAGLPTGRWFGVDGLVRRVIFRQKD